MAATTPPSDQPESAPLILSVNGHALHQRVEQEALTFEGFRVAAVTTCDDAVQFILTEQLLPVLVLLNLIELSDDATDLVDVLHTQQPRIPVVLLTTSPDVAAWATAIGADAFLPMPFNLDDLINLVTRVIREQENGDIAHQGPTSS